MPKSQGKSQHSKIIDCGGKYLQEIFTLHAACLDNGWSKDTLAETMAQAGSRCLMLLVNSQPAGFVLFRIMAEEAEIISIGVLEKFRKQGMALRLVNKCLKAAKENQVKEIFLEVAENNQAALALYKNLGFRESGRRKGYYPGTKGRVDAKIMKFTASPQF